MLFYTAEIIWYVGRVGQFKTEHGGLGMRSQSGLSSPVILISHARIIELLYDMKQKLKGEFDLRSTTKRGHPITKNIIKLPTLQVHTIKRPSVYTFYSSRLAKKKLCITFPRTQQH